MYKTLWTRKTLELILHNAKLENDCLGYHNSQLSISPIESKTFALFSQDSVLLDH